MAVGPLDCNCFGAHFFRTASNFYMKLDRVYFWRRPCLSQPAACLGAEADAVALRGALLQRLRDLGCGPGRGGQLDLWAARRIEWLSGLRVSGGLKRRMGMSRYVVFWRLDPSKTGGNGSIKGCPIGIHTRRQRGLHIRLWALSSLTVFPLLIKAPFFVAEEQK